MQFWASGESPPRVEPGHPNLGRPWQDRGLMGGPGRAHNSLPGLCLRSRPFCLDIVSWAYWRDGDGLPGRPDNPELASPPPPVPTGLSLGVPGPATPCGFPFPIPLSFQGGGHRNVTGGRNTADSLVEVGPDQGISPWTDWAARTAGSSFPRLEAGSQRGGCLRGRLSPRARGQDASRPLSWLLGWLVTLRVLWLADASPQSLPVSWCVSLIPGRPLLDLGLSLVQTYHIVL